MFKQGSTYQYRYERLRIGIFHSAFLVISRTKYFITHLIHAKTSFFALRCRFSPTWRLLRNLSQSGWHRYPISVAYFYTTAKYVSTIIRYFK